MTLNLLFTVCALICFVLATIGVSSRVNLTALGLAFLTLAMVVL